jgi:hypothetical protein
VVVLKNLFHKGAKERSEFVRKRKAILGLGFVAVPKREWTVREVEEVVEARMALWKRVRSSSSGLGGERGTCLRGRI